MKSIVYLALVLITTSCSTINYYGNGKLKKVRVDRTSEIVHASDHVISVDSTISNIKNYEVQIPNPALLIEVPNKSSKAFAQSTQTPILNVKSSIYRKKNSLRELSQKRFKTTSDINTKVSSKQKCEGSHYSRTNNGFEEMGKALLMALITIGGILLLLLLIWVFTAFTEIALLVLGYILLIAMIIFVIGFPIVAIIALIRGEDVEGKWFTLWLSVLGVFLGGIALAKK